MYKLYKAVFISLLMFQFSFSQKEKQISGTIICDNIAVYGIEITNLVTEKSTVSDVNGNFSILVKAEDMLVFTSTNYLYKRKFLEQEDIDLAKITIILTRKVEQLDEVLVSSSNGLDAVKLGIIKKPIKILTPAERRLKNAGKFTPKTLLLSLASLSIPIEPIINAISGRTNKLKSNLEIEKCELLLVKVKSMYQNEYYNKTLKIDPILIIAFQYYIITDAEFVKAIKSKNKTKISFRMIQMAQEFNDLQKTDK